MVQAVSVLGGKAKFVEAKLDVPLVEEEELVLSHVVRHLIGMLWWPLKP